MRTRIASPEVLYPDEPLVRVTRQDLAELRALAKKGPRGRARLCAHPGSDDPLHEMLIVLPRQSYIRPHKHPNKSESFHIVEGSGRVVLFDDDGKINEVIALGDYASNRCFYYRLAEPRFHTIIVESDLLVVHETTNGPFKKADAIYATWAPMEEDAAAGEAFRAELIKRVASFEG